MEPVSDANATDAATGVANGDDADDDIDDGEDQTSQAEADDEVDGEASASTANEVFYFITEITLIRLRSVHFSSITGPLSYINLSGKSMPPLRLKERS